jgi:hypothetical protein
VSGVFVLDATEVWRPSGTYDMSFVKEIET